MTRLPGVAFALVLLVACQSNEDWYRSKCQGRGAKGGVAAFDDCVRQKRADDAYYDRLLNQHQDK